jgi:hypothetical protein
MKRICINFLDFFMNLVSSCVQYVHGESMYIGYVPNFVIAKRGGDDHKKQGLVT